MESLADGLHVRETTRRWTTPVFWQAASIFRMLTKPTELTMSKVYGCSTPLRARSFLEDGQKLHMSLWAEAIRLIHRRGNRCALQPQENGSRSVLAGQAVQRSRMLAVFRVRIAHLKAPSEARLISALLNTSPYRPLRPSHRLHQTCACQSDHTVDPDDGIICRSHGKTDQ